MFVKQTIYIPNPPNLTQNRLCNRLFLSEAKVDFIKATPPSPNGPCAHVLQKGMRTRDGKVFQCSFSNPVCGALLLFNCLAQCQHSASTGWHQLASLDGQH